ncbi:MAG: hypothetical protein PHC61_14670, partial [Chitinivibrionales bacterium]|nr:hypothetical protein [Chitinivibrionales bacterium]
MLRIFLGIALCLIVAAANSAPLAESILAEKTAPDSTQNIIRAIVIHGNAHTKEFIVRMYLKLDTGSRLETSTVPSARRRLMNSNLFSKVDIFPLRTEGGITLHVIVSELFYIKPDVGLQPYSRLYGGNEYWLRASAGLTDLNFRGLAEILAAHCSFWEARSLSAYWYKPLFPSPYFFSVSASGSDVPSLSDDRKRRDADISGALRIGRSIGGFSKIYCLLT